jgi:hypothetical protein
MTIGMAIELDIAGPHRPSEMRHRLSPEAQPHGHRLPCRPPGLRVPWRPPDVDSYREYRPLSIEFIHARNRRIDALGL